MRISERHRYQLASDRVERAKSHNATALESLSTQKRINNISDDPIAASNAIVKKDRIDIMKTFQRNIMFSKGFLDTSDTALQGITDRLARAHELAVAMANDSYSADSREATSREVSEIIHQLVQLGNSTYNGRFVFSGFRTDHPALSQEGDYLGDDGAIFLQVEDLEMKQVNLPGRDLFEASGDERAQGHINLIDGVELLKQGLLSNDKNSIYRAIEEINFQMDKSTAFQANVGAIWGAIDQAEQRLETKLEQEIAGLSKLEDADIYKVSSDFKRSETILQSTLMASNKLLQPSLLNFMQ